MKLSMGNAQLCPDLTYRGWEFSFCYSWSRKVPWQSCSGLSVPLTKNCLVPEQLFPIKIIAKWLSSSKFQLYSLCAIGLQKDFLKKKSRLAIVTVLNSVKLSWSRLLVELASRVLQRRGSAPLLPSHLLFQMIAWLLSLEPPTSLLESLYCLGSSN